MRSVDAVGVPDKPSELFDPHKDLSPEFVAKVTSSFDALELVLEANMIDLQVIDDLSILTAWQFVDQLRTQQVLDSLDKSVDRNWDQVVALLENKPKSGRSPHSWSMVENAFIYLCHLLPHRTKDFKQLLSPHKGNLEMPDPVTRDLCTLLLDPSYHSRTPHTAERLKGILIIHSSLSLPDWKAYAREFFRSILLDPSLLDTISIDANDKKELLRSVNSSGLTIEQQGWVVNALVFTSAQEVSMDEDGRIRVTTRKQLPNNSPLPLRQPI